MKNKFIVFFLLVAIISVLILGIVLIISLQRSIESSDPDMNKIFDFFGMEKDLCYASAFGANQGFAINPYHAGNPGRDMAVIIGASVSYILREVKYFTLLVVVLTVLALNACSIIVYYILDKAANPAVKQLEDRTAGAALLALEIDEMLAEIDLVTERSKVKWSF